MGCCNLKDVACEKKLLFFQWQKWNLENIYAYFQRDPYKKVFWFWKECICWILGYAGYWGYATEKNLEERRNEKKIKTLMFLSIFLYDFEFCKLFERYVYRRMPVRTCPIGYPLFCKIWKVLLWKMIILAKKFHVWYLKAKLSLKGPKSYFFSTRKYSILTKLLISVFLHLYP